MWRHSISTILGLCALALFLHASAPRAQPPDAARYGIRLELGDVAQLRKWLDEGLDPDFVADRIGTGLMIAAWYGNIPMMELLVARGADVNKANALGERALMHAGWRGQAAAAKWLLEHGARVDSEPMHWGALHYAVFAGHAEVAKLLLDNGADINARSTNGSSVLMMAVYEGHEDMVRQLMARGADNSIRNDRGDDALSWAMKFKRLSIARLVALPQDFAAAASLPKAHWGEPVRSQPAPSTSAAPATDEKAEKIRELTAMRDTLAKRGQAKAAAKLDQRIAYLRAQRARENRDASPVRVLEISASRASPGKQKAQLLFEPNGPPP